MLKYTKTNFLATDMTTRQFRIIASLTIVTSAIALIAIQLSQFAVDTSLRNWHENAEGFKTALGIQKATKKPIALFFHTDWCVNCKKLRENILSSSEFDRYLKNVIPVKINPEAGSKERQIADKYAVRGYPTFLMIGPDSYSVSRLRTSQNLTPQQFVDQCKSTQNI